MKNRNTDGRKSTKSRPVSAVSVERMTADVLRLCESPRHGAENTEAHLQAASYISSELEAVGCSVDRQQFTVPSSPESRPGLNVIGVLSDDESVVRNAESALIVGAHYDTVSGSPGADDNASGVAVMLECARVMSGVQRRRPIIFIAFDAEERQPEVGLHGSTAYVDSLQSGPDAPAITAAYILEMVGFSAPPGDQKVPAGLQLAFPRAFDRLREEQFAGNSVVAISNRPSRTAGRALEKASKTADDGVLILPVEIPRWMPVPHNLRRSDHAPFWDAGIPAVMIGDTANFRNPHYHEATDIPETLDYQLMGRVARTMVELCLHHVSS